MKTVTPIKNLPKIYQQIYHHFLIEVEKGNDAQARQLIRPLLELYTANEWDIPPEIEMRYGQLYLLELNKEKN
jgi:hypothetical protein